MRSLAGTGLGQKVDGLPLGSRPLRSPSASASPSGRSPTPTWAP